MTTLNVDPSTPLEELWSGWLSEIKNEVDETTLELYELHGTTHLVPFFRTFGATSTATCATYGRKRLGVVKRVTVKKEQSTLRRFLYWCAEQGYIDEPPIVPPLPRRAPGTPFHIRRRGRATELNLDEVRAIIDHLCNASIPDDEPPFNVIVDAEVLPDHTVAGALQRSEPVSRPYALRSGVQRAWQKPWRMHAIERLRGLSKSTEIAAMKTAYDVL